MRKFILATTVLLVLALALPMRSEGQNKGKKDKGGQGDLSPAVAQAVEAALRSAEITGVLLAVDADSSTATLRLDIPVWDRNPAFKGGGGNNNIMQQMQRLMQGGRGGRGGRGGQNPIQIMKQMAQGGGKGGGAAPFIMTTHTKEIKLEANKAIVKQGKETAKFDSLTPGMTVKVFPAKATPTKDANKKADDLDLEGNAVSKLKVRQIVIVDAAGAVPEPAADKKKK